MNALSHKVEVVIRRDGVMHQMDFRNGDRASDLTAIGSVPKKQTGTRLRFWPDAKYFDSPKISLPRLKHVLRAKAVLCPGLNVKLFDEASGERVEWLYEDGLRDYLRSMLKDQELLPPAIFVASLKKEVDAVELAVCWTPEGELTQESYVNLIPTAQHGTHANG